MLNFLNGLDKDLRKALLIQLRNLWTHTSTAIEGNTLTLSETAFVLEERLTISGKLLKDHEEVVGHARAIDLIYDLVQNETSFTENELFSLHTAVQAEVIVDVYKPVGRWKNEPNSTAYVPLHVSFVRIHPFFDGNGRLARLIANIPILKSGLPPVIIPKEQRKQYIDALSAYHFSAGQIKAGDSLLPNPDALQPFILFYGEAWEATLANV